MAQRKYYRKTYQTDEKRKKVSLILKLLGSCFLSSVIFVLFLFIFYAKDLPRPEIFTERAFVQPTKIYTRDGETLLYEIYGEEKRTVVPIEKMSKYLKEGVVAVEDANFYNHSGIDLKAIFRALMANLRLGGPTQGASTISQQLIRSSFLTRKKTAERKIREIILTLELERRYPKNQILEFYLNQIPFGSNTYGVESASQTYFNKSCQNLSAQEAAVLIALIQTPSYLSPYGEHKDELLDRKDYILDRMAQTGLLTQQEKEEAKKQEIEFSQTLISIKAAHFVFYVMDYLVLEYGEDFLQEKGLKVYTSLDWELQEAAEEAVREGVKANQGYQAFNAALAAIDPKTGEILAMVGSKDWSADPYPEGCSPGKNCFFEPKVNITTYGAGQQPGSAFKPFVYAAAFKKGYNDKTIVIDEETNFGIWGGKPYIPQNYDGKFRGPVTLRQALSQSLNVPAVKVLADLAGLEESIQTAKDLGITTLDRPSSFYGLSLVLGGGEVKLLDMVSAYGVFATEGLRIPPVSILKIEDEEGNIIEENKKTPKRVLEKETARLINDILSDNNARAPMFGANSVLYFEDYDVAVKTGTTEDYRDGWTVGFSPSISAGVWVGNNNNAPMVQKPGVVLAGPIWREFMRKALLKFPQEKFLSIE